MHYFSYKRVILASIAVTLATGLASAADKFDSALKVLQAAESGTSSQSEIQKSWQLVSNADASQISPILTAMRGVGPVAENWLRAAVDTIAEREIQKTGKLSVEELEKFVQDRQQSPRARRTAFEWLAEVDSTARERLLPQLLDDTSLELRYDAVAQVLAEAKQATGSQNQLELYKRALSAARARDQMTTCIEKLQELGEPPNLENYFSYITNWMVIGPFDNADGVGIETVYPPEKETNFSQEYTGKSDQVSWVAYQPEADDLDDVGRVDLNSVLKEEKGVVAYAAATVILPSDQEVECRYETVNATELWVNGMHLATDDIYHAGGEFDQYVVPVKLSKGKNTILIKVCQNEQTESWARPWNFRLRITDQLGAGIKFSYQD